MCVIDGVPPQHCRRMAVAVACDQPPLYLKPYLWVVGPTPICLGAMIAESESVLCLINGSFGHTGSWLHMVEQLVWQPPPMRGGGVPSLNVPTQQRTGSPTLAGSYLSLLRPNTAVYGRGEL